MWNLRSWKGGKSELTIIGIVFGGWLKNPETAAIYFRRAGTLSVVLLRNELLSGNENHRPGQPMIFYLRT